MAAAAPLLFAFGGQVLGGFLAGPIGAAIGGLAGGLIGTFLFSRTQKPQVPDVNLMTSSYGNPIPIIWGTVRLPGTVIWMTQINVVSHPFGKGLGGAGSNPYSFYQDAAVAFCEGPATLIRLYLDGKIFIDNTNHRAESTKYRFPVRAYPGDDTQLPDHKYALWVKQMITSLPQAAPAYRGLAYTIFDHIDLVHFGGRFPQTTAVWSNNAVYDTLFQQLSRFANDTALISPGGNSSMTVDWLREYVYTAAADGTLRSFDLRTGQQVAQVSATYRPNTTNPTALIPGPFDVLGPTQVTFDAIVAGVGTELYGFSQKPPAGMAPVDIPPGSIDGDGTDANNWWTITRLNPDTLLPNTIGDSFLFKYAGLVGDNLPNVTIAFQLVSLEGSQDMIIGTWILEGQAWVLNPTNGFFRWAPMALDSVFSKATCCLGATDPLQGTADAWFANYDNLATVDGVRLYSAQINGADYTTAAKLALSDPYAPQSLDLVLRGQITPARVGQSPAPISPSIIFDPTDGTIILYGLAWGTIQSLKWDPATDTILWTSTHSPGSGPNSVIDTGTFGGNSFSTIFADAISVATTNDGSVQLSPTQAGVGVGLNSIAAGLSYDSYGNRMVYRGSDNEIYVASLLRTVATAYPVASIILDICARVGVDSSLIDVSLVTDTVWGYAIADNRSAGSALADLCHAFQLDMVESDYKLRFVPRGQASVLSLTQDQLGSTDANDAGRFWEVKRAQELEMPLQIDIKYQDPNLDYNPGSQYARRTALPVPTVFSKRKLKLDLPIVAEATTARQIAEKWLYTMWAERDEAETVLSPAYLWLDPADNVTVTLDNGDVYEMRTTTVQTGADLSMRVTVSSEDATVYEGSSSKGADYGTTPQVLTPAPFGRLLLFNVPLLQDIDDTAGASMRIYYAAGATSGWVGGGVYNSLDTASWTLISSLSTPANWGSAVTVLGDTPAAFSTDRTNTLTILLAGGSEVPSGCTYLEMMNGANGLLVGEEVIQFQNVTDNGDGTVTLDTLLRGRRGTEWAIGSHAEGDRCIFLALGALGSARKPLAEIGVGEFWKLLPFGRFMDQVPATSFTYLGYDLKPYAPVHLARAASGADLVVTWTRRSRIGGYLIDGSDTAPLGEASEAYEAYILANAASIDTFDPTSPSSYVRAFTGLTAATLTYTAAEMTTDGFTPATDTLYLAVYQLSAAIGRGFRAYKALPAF